MCINNVENKVIEKFQMVLSFIHDKVMSLLTKQVMHNLF